MAGNKGGGVGGGQDWSEDWRGTLKEGGVYSWGRCAFEETVPEVPCIKSYLRLLMRVGGAGGDY